MCSYMPWSVKFLEWEGVRCPAVCVRTYIRLFVWLAVEQPGARLQELAERGRGWTWVIHTAPGGLAPGKGWGCAPPGLGVVTPRCTGVVTPRCTGVVTPRCSGVVTPRCTGVEAPSAFSRKRVVKIMRLKWWWRDTVWDLLNRTPPGWWQLVDAAFGFPEVTKATF